MQMLVAPATTQPYPVRRSTECGFSSQLGKQDEGEQQGKGQRMPCLQRPSVTFRKALSWDGFIPTAHCFPAQHASLIVIDEIIRARLALRVAIHRFLQRAAPMRNQYRLRSNSRL